MLLKVSGLGNGTKLSGLCAGMNRLWQCLNHTDSWQRLFPLCLLSLQTVNSWWTSLGLDLLIISWQIKLSTLDPLPKSCSSNSHPFRRVLHCSATPEIRLFDRSRRRDLMGAPAVWQVRLMQTPAHILPGLVGRRPIISNLNVWH